MSVAIETGFDMMLTVDKNLEHQQNLNNYDITIVVFDVLFNKLEELVPLLSQFYKEAETYEKKRAYVLKKTTN